MASITRAHISGLRYRRGATRCPRALNTAAGAAAGDEDDWRSWKAVGDEVLHIELRRWADVLVVAPLSANTLAKVACGLCDNLLTCVVRAWDWQKPLLVRRLLIQASRVSLAASRDCVRTQRSQ